MEYVSRCPACSSLVRRGQDWCTLCHTDLRPPELRSSAAAPAEIAEHVVEHDVEVDPLEAPLAVLLALQERPQGIETAPDTAPAASLGKHARHAAPDSTGGDAAPAEPPAPAASPLDEAEVARLLARLAAESADPIGGIVSRLPESQGARVVLALAVGGAVATLLILVSWLIGLVFG
jgi:hypothetical protein